jgi:hypothetical protein
VVHGATRITDIDLHIALALLAHKSPSSLGGLEGQGEAAVSDRPRGENLTVTARIDAHY